MNCKSLTRCMILALALLLMATSSAWAHIDPPGARGTGVSVALTIYRNDGVTPAAFVSPCETIKIQATLTWAGTVNNVLRSSFEGGSWSITTPAGTVNVTPVGGIPCIGDPLNSVDDPNSASNGNRGLCAGTPGTINSQMVTYTVQADHIVGGFVNFSTVYENGWNHILDGDLFGAGGYVTGAVPVIPCAASTDCADNICDPAATDSGRTGICVIQFKPLTTICRAAVDVCDVAESCTGTSAACPADGFSTATTICRAAVDVCDVAESCTGTSAACPADGFSTATTICRAAVDVCDVAESCTGTSAACPGDSYMTATTPCNTALCQSCTGESATCPTEDICPEEEGCLTRTPGFWCTHDRVTDKFLPVSVCGIWLNNTDKCSSTSAVEALNFSGKDFKDNSTTPQQLQLIRQCTAAALNFAATLAGGGDCSNVNVPCWDPRMMVWHECEQTIEDVYDECCDAISLCTAQACGQTISNSKCIERLDWFNNLDGDYDTLNCDTMDMSSRTYSIFCPSLGANRYNATPRDCQAANGNGCVIDLNGATPGKGLGPRCKGD